MKVLQLKRTGILLTVLLLAASMGRQSSAFSSSQLPTQREATDSDRSTQTGLHMSNVFDDIGKFFQDAMGDGSNNEGRQNGDACSKEDDEDDGDAEYAGATRLLTIPAKSIKPGGLRLLLMFYCMGMQNTPEVGAWKADQPTRDEYVVDMYYHDRTALLSVKLTDDEITISRIGSVPSMQYLTQESVIVDGILDELQVCVSQEDVKDEDRLLLLPEPQDAIEKARESLAFS